MIAVVRTLCRAPLGGRKFRDWCCQVHLKRRRVLFSLVENPTFEGEQIRNGFSLAATLLTGTNKSIQLTFYHFTEQFDFTAPQADNIKFLFPAYFLHINNVIFG